VAVVLGSALKDSDPGLRLQVVEVLGQMDSELANKYLISALRDRNPFVRGKVMQVLDARERIRLVPEPDPQQAVQATP
jgi:HEAT repeat protein